MKRHAMPTSPETLVRYRAAHVGGPESRRVRLFHSHAYLDHRVAHRIAEARAFMGLIRRTFAGTAHLEVHSFIPAPAGPHPRGSFEVLFTREVFADYVSWLMFARPERLDRSVASISGFAVHHFLERLAVQEAA